MREQALASLLDVVQHEMYYLSGKQDQQKRCCVWLLFGALWTFDWPVMQYVCLIFEEARSYAV
jgi:hypothetical protein